MGNARLRIEGLDELRAALRQLPETLREEGSAIVRRHAEATRATTVANYPEVTGNLKRGVVLREERSAFGILVTVASRSQHAHLYEQGRQGQPPAPPERRLVTHAMRERHKMYEELAALLRRQGLEVTGDVGG